MRFIDEVTINVQAGKGGDGCCSFRREKFIPWGGPDGGNGGDGGDVYLQATSRLHTLVDLNYRKEYQATKGQPGRGNLCTGRSADHLFIQVPLGTIVWEADTEELIGDLTQAGQLLLVAKGGSGGLGNYNFKTSTNRAPRKTIPGSLGQQRNLKLELKLLADVGLLGSPNVGKSTLISKVSAAKPKIASYPFTTMDPQLGVVKALGNSFVMADLPGLVVGAAAGVGLGIRFLKHLARNKLLLHIIDLAAAIEVVSSQAIMEDLEFTDPIILQEIASNLLWQLKVITHEVVLYNDPKLLAIPRWIVINKIEILVGEALTKLQAMFTKIVSIDLKDQKFTKIFWISALSGVGLENLCTSIAKYLATQPQGDGDGRST